MINGKTKLLCLLGSPVAHSFSPAMHNAAFKKLGINASYMAFDIPSESIEATLKTLKEVNFVGANFTSPHKNAVIPFLDKIDPLALKIGAVNTVNYIEGKLIGYNTDVLGFVEALKIRDIQLEKKKIAILGTGGAAQAASVGLLNEQVESIHIFSRSLEKSRGLLNQLESPNVFAVTYDDTMDFKSFDIIVNATPIGMHPYEDKTPISVKDFGHESSVYYDLIYNPPETIFLQEAKELNRVTINGLDMLIFQGIYALRYWYDFDDNQWTRDDVLAILKANGVVSEEI